jgi:hypothetical protein
MGCPTPRVPKQGYLVTGSNSSRAEFICSVDHVIIQFTVFKWIRLFNRRVIKFTACLGVSRHGPTLPQSHLPGPRRAQVERRPARLHWYY